VHSLSLISHVRDVYCIPSNATFLLFINTYFSVLLLVCYAKVVEINLLLHGIQKPILSYFLYISKINVNIFFSD